MTARQRLFALAWTFPVLQGYLRTAHRLTGLRARPGRTFAPPDVTGTELDLVAFDEVVAANAVEHAELQAAAFILSLWADDAEWKVGRFRIGLALRKWDHEQRAAFQAWAREPWLP